MPVGVKIYLRLRSISWMASEIRAIARDNNEMNVSMALISIRFRPIPPTRPE